MAIYLLMATPIINCASDFTGYLAMFWRVEFKLSVHEFFRDFEFDPYDDGHTSEHT